MVMVTRWEVPTRVSVGSEAAPDGGRKKRQKAAKETDGQEGDQPLFKFKDALVLLST